MSYTMAELSNVSAKFMDNVDWREFACGWGSAVTNISITYPINKIIFRQMLDGVGARKAIVQLYGEGVFYLYRGILPPLCQKTLSMSVMFGVYGASFNYLTLDHSMNIYVAKVISALLSGTMEALLTPLERVQTLLQHRAFHEQYNNTLHAFKLLKRYGIKEYYRGIGPILLRNGPSNVCFFILRDELKKITPNYESAMKMSVLNFLMGAILGSSISAVFYPLNVVKVHMQDHIGGEKQRTWNVLVNIYRERGSKLGNVYRGVSLNCTRAFVSWGVVCAAYEQIKKSLY